MDNYLWLWMKRNGAVALYGCGTQVHQSCNRHAMETVKSKGGESSRNDEELELLLVLSTLNSAVHLHN